MNPVTWAHLKTKLSPPLEHSHGHFGTVPRPSTGHSFGSAGTQFPEPEPVELPLDDIDHGQRYVSTIFHHHDMKKHGRRYRINFEDYGHEYDRWMYNKNNNIVHNVVAEYEQTIKTQQTNTAHTWATSFTMTVETPLDHRSYKLLCLAKGQKLERLIFYISQTTKSYK